MNKEQLKNLSNEELKAKYKSATAVLQVSMVLFVIYVTYMIYSLFTGNWDFNISSGVVLLLFIAAFLPNSILRKQLKEEMDRRHE
jgi:Kef-type K+ transport system membrane component KefB